MRDKKGKKTLQGPPEAKQQEAIIAANVESGELSTIAPSFLEGLQNINGAPLHSTALEEDLCAAQDHQEIQKKKRGKKTTKKQQPAANQDGKENRKKPKSIPQKSKKTGPGVDRQKALKRKSSGNTVAARPAKKQKAKSKMKTSSGSERDPQSQEELDCETSRSHSDSFSCDDDDDDVGDRSWKPSPKKPQMKGFGPTQSRTSSSDKSRKSSSGSGSQSENIRNKKKSQKRSGDTEFEVIMEEFMDFCEQHKETVESRAVKQALDHFSSSVKAQLTERISSSKNLKTAMRESSKLASKIRTKRQRLLDAKHKFIKAERTLCLLQKDKSKLEQNLEDLTRGRAFLQNIRELNKRYLQHRQEHPEEKETYGASSLPALLIEAKHVQTTELQLKGINDRLQKHLKENTK